MYKARYFKVLCQICHNTYKTDSLAFFPHLLNIYYMHVCFMGKKLLNPLTEKKINTESYLFTHT